jgi:hypothetical protein
VVEGKAKREVLNALKAQKQKDEELARKVKKV